VFVILTRGRTGSTALADACDHLEGVRCYLELLRRTCEGGGTLHEHDGPGYRENGRCLSYVHFASDMSLVDWLSMVETEGRAAHGSIVGLKVLYGALDDWEPLGGLLTERARVIHLTRNPFYEAVSGAYANATGIWNVHHDDTPRSARLREVRAVPVRLDPEVILREVSYSLHRRRQVEDLLAGCARPVTTVAFEDLFPLGSGDGLDAVADFLGVPRAPAYAPSFRQVVVDHNAQIENWAGIQQAIEDSEFASLLQTAGG
jgi:hypothetical protein